MALTSHVDLPPLLQDDLKVEILQSGTASFDLKSLYTSSVATSCPDRIPASALLLAEVALMDPGCLL